MTDTLVHVWYRWLSPLTQAALGLGVVALLLSPFVVVEFQIFKQRDKLRSAVLLHAAALLILPLAVAPAVVIPKGIEGMEALGAFFALLFTLTPVLYYVLHYLAGRLLRPGLRLWETAIVATTSVLLLGGLVTVVTTSVKAFSGAERRARSKSRDRARERPGPLQQTGSDWIRMPDGMRLAHVTLAPVAEGTLDRLDLDFPGRRFRGMRSVWSTYLCRRTDEYHLFFTVEPEGVPKVVYYWYRGGSPQMYVSTVAPKLPTQDPAPFTLSRRSRGVVQPLPLPPAAVRFEYRYPRGNLAWRDYASLFPESAPRSNTCLPDFLPLPDEVERVEVRLSRPGVIHTAHPGYVFDVRPGAGAGPDRGPEPAP